MQDPDKFSNTQHTAGKSETRAFTTPRALPLRLAQLLGITEAEATHLSQTFGLAVSQLLVESGSVHVPYIGDLVTEPIPPHLSFGSSLSIKFKQTYGAILDVINGNRSMPKYGQTQADELVSMLLPEHLEAIENLRAEYAELYPDATKKKDSPFYRTQYDRI